MQVLDAVHPPARVHDRAAVGVGAHAAGARRVVVGVHARCDRGRDRAGVAVGDGWAGRQLGPLDQAVQRGGAADRPGDERGFDHAAHVVRVAEMGHVDAWRVGGVGRPDAYPARE